MTIEQKKEMVIKGYNPMLKEDVQKYLNGIPKDYNYENEDLGGANQKTESFDESGESVGIVNESLFLSNNKQKERNNNVTKKVSINEDPFDSVLSGNTNNKTKQDGYNEMTECLVEFIKILKGSNNRKQFLIKYNNIIKNNSEQYLEGVKIAEQKLLKRFS